MENKPSDQTAYTQNQTEHFSPFKSFLNGLFFTMGALTILIVVFLVFFLISIFFFGNLYSQLFA